MSILKKMKQRVKQNKIIVTALNRLNLHNKFAISQGNAVLVDSLINRSQIMISGKNNQVSIKKSQAKNRIRILINGNNNTVLIQENVVMVDMTIWIEDDNNFILISKDNTFAGKIQLSAIEGTGITIGQGCLFSDDIDIRTGDGHAIMENGVRTNTSKNITFGAHVWCGRGVTVLKGVNIANDTVISTRSVVTKSITTPHVIIAGIPAKIVKDNISWKFDR